jgi:hypothetical protein
LIEKTPLTGVFYFYVSGNDSAGYQTFSSERVKTSKSENYLCGLWFLQVLLLQRSGIVFGHR